MAFIAGPYTATFGGTAIGKVEDGFRLNVTFNGEPVTTDDLGDSIQDIVYRGGNVFVDFVLAEYDKAVLAKLVHPYSTTQGAIGRVGKIHLDTDSTFYGAFVLTKVTGTNATHSSLTLPKAILAPGFPIDILLASKLRRLPIRLQGLPSGSSGSEIWYSVT